MVDHSFLMINSECDTTIMYCKSENFAGNFLNAKFSDKQPILRLGVSNHELHVISSD